MKYFLTSLSPTKNLATLNWQTMILEKYTADSDYWEKAKSELSNDVKWVTQDELYKNIKRNDGQGAEIILSRTVGSILETIKNDFPNAYVWIY
jgi:hypothetical protein